jgi:flagellar basal body rod protein FlgG
LPKGDTVIYGLYLSAAGVIANSYRMDVLSNNLANSETIGFKRDLAEFQARPTESQERGGGADNWSDPTLEGLGGGLLLHPTMVDDSQGQIEETNNPLDLAVNGSGFFSVESNGQQYLTRDGRMEIGQTGQLIRAATGQPVLDPTGNPIQLSNSPNTLINNEGVITQDGKAVGRIGLFDVSDPSRLAKKGGGLLDYSQAGTLNPGTGTIRSEFVERSNVDPTTELTDLMQTQQQLEDSANMIRYQDQTMQELVDQVGKIS